MYILRRSAADGSSEDLFFIQTLVIWEIDVIFSICRAGRVLLQVNFKHKIVVIETAGKIQIRFKFKFKFFFIKPFFWSGEPSSPPLLLSSSPPLHLDRYNNVNLSLPN